MKIINFNGVALSEMGVAKLVEIQNDKNMGIEMHIGNIDANTRTLIALSEFADSNEQVKLLSTLHILNDLRELLEYLRAPMQ